MKQYDSYKDSGVEWIGKVPSHWEVVPIKFTGAFGNGLTYSPKDVVDNGILVLRSSNIQNSSLSFEDNVYVSNAPKELLVKRGDIVICSRNGSAALVGKSAFIDKDINATFGAFMMRYVPKINKKFGFYLFQTAIGRYKGYFATTTINQLTKSTIGEMKVPLANTEEQSAIVTYLDKKCSEIDKVISAQQKRIALLQELKQSVITHAVTKGLDPNVKMKDSGVEWIGKVPIHWEVVPFKRVISINNGSDYKHIQVEEGGYPVIGSGGEFARAYQYLYDGEAVLLGRKGTIDKPMYYNGKFWTVDTMFYGIPKDNANCKYLYYQALNIPFGRYATSTALPSMTQTDLNNNIVCLPPLDEQSSIASYLDKKCSSLDNSISKAQHQVELLQEYKQSLITEVVTGKRKVC